MPVHESKRKLIEQAASDLIKEMTDKGKLIELGFVMFAAHVIAKDAPAVQYSEMRLAFMAGAEHVFSSIMNILDPGDEPTDPDDEPTEDDLRRMDMIHKEIDEWRATLSERIQPAQGRA